MKSTFSASWKRSKQPRKQRKYQYNAPLHIKHKFLSIQLSKELRQKYGIRNIPARKGDLVRVTMGNYKGKEGKIDKVMLKETKVQIAGVQKIKSDGKKIPHSIHPSNLVIKELDLSDRKRKEIIERKKSKGVKENASN
jgi:large subunit ribosomal protein L24